MRLAPARETDSELAPEAVAIAKKMLLELEPERGPRGGFTITTTIDPRLQAAARKALRENLQAYDKRHALRRAAEGAERGAGAQKGKKGRRPAAAGRSKARRRSSRTRSSPASSSSADDVDGHHRRARRHRARLGEDCRLQALQPAEPAAEPVRGGRRARARQPARAGAERRGADRKESAAPRRSRRCRCASSSGPESALVVLDVRTRQVLALVGSYEGAAGGLDRATQSRSGSRARRSSRSSTRTRSTRGATRRRRSSTCSRRCSPATTSPRTTRAGPAPTRFACARRSRTR